MLDRLDLAAQRGQRGAPQAPQHIRIAPLALGPAGPQLAADEQPVALELEQLGREIASEPLFGIAGS